MDVNSNKGTVLSLFDFSGNMVRPWAEAGYECICVDIQHKGTRREGNITFVEADVLKFLPPIRRYVFAAAFPPCTDLAVSGSRWFSDESRGKGLGALAHAIECFHAAKKIMEWTGAPFIIENPVSTISSYWRKPDHTFDPWQYSGLCADDYYTKKTCLWTGGGFVMPEHDYDRERYERGLAAWKHFKKTGEKLPDLKDYPDDRIHKATPGDDRANIRSKTPMGFAIACFRANGMSKVTTDND